MSFLEIRVQLHRDWKRHWTAGMVAHLGSLSRSWYCFFFGTLTMRRLDDLGIRVSTPLGGDWLQFLDFVMDGGLVLLDSKVGFYDCFLQWVSCKGLVTERRLRVRVVSPTVAGVVRSWPCLLDSLILGKPLLRTLSLSSYSLRKPYLTASESTIYSKYHKRGGKGSPDGLNI